MPRRLLKRRLPNIFFGYFFGPNFFGRSLGVSPYGNACFLRLFMRRVFRRFPGRLFKVFSNFFGARPAIFLLQVLRCLPAEAFPPRTPFFNLPNVFYHLFSAADITFCLILRKNIVNRRRWAREEGVFLGSPFHANRAPEKVLLAKVFWEEEKTRSAFTVCALRKQCEA